MSANPTRVEAIHTRMLARYGSEWRMKWQAIDPSIVLADWHEATDSLSDEAVLYGLDNLPPDRPPNAMQFRAACQRYARPMSTYLPRPKPTQAEKDARRTLLADVKHRLALSKVGGA